MLLSDGVGTPRRLIPECVEDLSGGRGAALLRSWWGVLQYAPT